MQELIDSVLANQTVDQVLKEASRINSQYKVSTRSASALSTTATVVGAMSLLTYLVPMTWAKLTHNVQDLKKKYNCNWALVTGGSSGIGLAIVERLAKQGINVVVVAYPDATLDKTCKELPVKFPQVQFRKVPCNLGAIGCLTTIEAATNDIEINVIFNNAGYITTGFFCDVSLERQMTNYHCNATAAVEITHHFVNKMLNKKQKGCVCFTSSPAGFTPTPFSVVYGSTKAFLTEFAASIAAELKPDGIDVCVVHPSPVASNFYDSAHAIDAINFFKSTAIGPERISDALFASVGRHVVRDQGYYPVVTKIMGKLIEFNLFADIIAFFAGGMKEFKTLKKQR